MLSSFSSILSLALLVPFVSSSPVAVKRDDVQCKIQSSGGFLVLTKAYGPTNVDDGIYVALSQDTIKDSTGAQAKYLTTKKPDGSAFSQEDSKFDFYSCDSKYMGYTTEDQGKQQEYFGHITLHGATKHCLTYSGSDINSASHSLFAHSNNCSFKDDQSQILNYWSLGTYYSAIGKVTTPKAQEDSANDHYITISDSGRVHFNPGKAPKGVTEYSFIPPH